MKLRKEKKDSTKMDFIYYLLHQEEEILLCVCVNCGEIHGLQPPTTLMDIDKKILCCQRPDNTKVLSNAMKPLSYFVKHWKDL